MSSRAGGVGLKATGWAMGALALCLLVVAVAWLIRSPGPQEAVGQEATTPTTTPSPAAPASPSASVPALFPELEEAFSSPTAEPEPEGIPGLGVTDVLGQLYRFPVGGRFSCQGPVPGDGDGTLWACYAPSPSEGRLPTHEVTVSGDDPRTVLWVRATVRGVSEEEAAEFFGYVGSLCLQETDDPLDPEAWARENAGGGRVFAQGAEFSVYGTGEERVLQVSATGDF